MFFLDKTNPSDMLGKPNMKLEIILPSPNKKNKFGWGVWGGGASEGETETENYNQFLELEFR